MAEKMIRTAFSLPASLWQSVIRAAAREQARTGKPMSAAAWVRRVLERAVARDERRTAK